MIDRQLVPGPSNRLNWIRAGSSCIRRQIKTSPGSTLSSGETASVVDKVRDNWTLK